jgi:4-hydroxybenzoate polyprenyltransferase
VRAAPSLAQHPLRATAVTAGVLVASLRPEQWTKNVLVFAGVLFSGSLGDPVALGSAVAAFVIFCALSGTGYLINDVVDREADQRHPLKRSRPIASGQLSPRLALTFAVTLGLSSLTAAALLAPGFGVVAMGYVSLLLGYSAFLKHLVILDVLTIAAGFVLRAAAGAIAVDVPISPWLLVCTTLLALFLALSKRRHELTLLNVEAGSHRPILNEYNSYLLDQMIAVVTASTVIAYSVYATSAETAERVGTAGLSLTIPFVLYGIFRYLYLVHRKDGGGSPTTMLLDDRPLLACVIGWAATVVILIYLR